MSDDSKSSSVLMIQYPLVRALEDHILVQSWRIDAMPPGAEEFVDRVTKVLFDNVYSDTLYRPSDIDADFDDFAEYQHDAQFETDDLSDDQVVTYFLPLGLDFRDERGHPLRATIFLARQAEAACKGIAGRLPSLAEQRHQSWEESLRREAATYLETRRKVRDR